MTGTMAGSAWLGGAGSVFAWTLLHSIWQAALVAGGLWLVLRLIPASMIRARTAAASAAFALVLGLAFATWIAIDTDWRAHDACWSSEAHALAHPATCASHGVPLPAEVLNVDGAKAGTRVVLPWAWISLSGIPGGRKLAPAALAATDWLAVVTAAWLVLALVALARFGAGLLALRRVVGRSIPVVSAGPRAQLESAARRSGVRREVDLRESGEVGAPAVTGWRRPVILLPAGMAETLEPGQLGCVLAHELVHVERRHFPLNLAQRLLECFLMISPGALWISRRIREEREALCDVAAAGAPAAGRRDYVETLLRLEALRSPAGPALIGLLGEGPLLRRVRRLLDGGTTRRRDRFWRGIAAGVAAALALLAIVEIGVTAAAVSSWAVMERDIHGRDKPEFQIAAPPATEDAATGRATVPQRPPASIRS